jgi:chromosome segregation ATPase
MSTEHKEALAKGRAEARAIKAYLRALKQRKPGRPVTRESLEAKLARLDEKIAAASDPLEEVRLRQERLDVEAKIAAVANGGNLEELESGFVAHAKSYSGRKGISYTAWRQCGVPAAVLKKAGIPQTRRRG